MRAACVWLSGRGPRRPGPPLADSTRRPVQARSLPTALGPRRGRVGDAVRGRDLGCSIGRALSSQGLASLASPRECGRAGRPRTSPCELFFRFRFLPLLTRVFAPSSRLCSWRILQRARPQRRSAVHSHPSVGRVLTRRASCFVPNTETRQDPETAHPAATRTARDGAE